MDPPESAFCVMARHNLYDLALVLAAQTPL
jgi:hypothetical protein